MSFKKKLGFNIIIHSLGSVSSFFVLYIILHFYGVEKQGMYANLMALINFIVGLGVFGFPQGYIYLINKMNIPHKKLSLLSIRLCFVCFILLSAGLFFNNRFTLNWIDSKLIEKHNLFLFSLANMNLILHGLLRGIYLTINQGVEFAFYSALPSFSILFCVGLGVVFNDSFVELHVLISTFLVLLYSIHILIKINKSSGKHFEKKIPYNVLFDHGFHSFLQALFYSVQPLFAFWVIKHFNGDYEDIGYFNIGLFLLQGFLVPVTMLSPYLFEFLTKNNSYSLERIVKKNTFYIYDLFLAIVLYFFVGLIGLSLFGNEYIIPIKLTQIILFSLPFNIHYRIILPFIHAKGSPIYNTMFGFIRLLFFAILTLLFIVLKINPLISLAFCWSISEIIIFIWAIIYTKKIIIHEYN